MTRFRYVCIDDPNWLEKGDQLLNYELDCVFNGVSSINIADAMLYHSGKTDVGTWLVTTYARFECNSEMPKWAGWNSNITFSIQSECDRNLIRISGYRQGAKCTITKNFLKSNIFKINRNILETRGDIWPYPYGLAIRYTCN